MKKKIILSVIGVVFVLGLALFIGLNWKAFGAVFKGQVIYTQEQVEKIKEDTRKDAIEQEENYIIQIENYKGLIEQNTKIINDYKFQVKQLQQEVDNLKATNKNLTETISLLESNIEVLNNQINQLTDELDYYKELLKSYENLNKLSVRFIVEEKVYNVQLLDSGELIDETKIITPSIEGYKFLGWTENGTDVVEDIFSKPVLEDKVYYAKLVNKNGTFSNGEYTLTVSDNKIIEFNGNVSELYKSQYDDNTYSHWIDGVDGGVCFSLFFDEETYNWVYKVENGGTEFTYNLLRVD